MQKLTAQDLLSLETYAREREDFRSRVLAHKRHRQVAIGPNMTWCFEDRLTVQYQVQEMLRTERIFEAAGIAEELQAYNPLIPDGANWKVTMLIEFTDGDERRVRLGEMNGIEHRCWAQVADYSRVLAYADEDLERSNDVKTSAVHFLRFELSEAMIASLQDGARLAMGADHPAYPHSVDTIADPVRRALLADFASRP